MKLTVLNVAYPLVPVSPDTAGGAEQILSALDRGLVTAGHRSIVLAARGSRVSGSLIASPVSSGRIDDSVRARAALEHREILKSILDSIHVDVVHLHGLDFNDYLPEQPVPCLATLHLPPDWYSPSVFRLTRPRTLLNCVSHSQRDRCPDSAMPVATITHGIDHQLYSREIRKRNYVAILGRVCPEKGFHTAMKAAEQARVPLIMAGQVFPYQAHEDYFNRQVAPGLNRNVRFIGPAGLKKKRRLLAGARCVLMPSTAAETSSLVAMEALASGTPVIAFRSGALPDIIEHGRTGFLVSDAAEMADAIQLAHRLSPDECRHAVRTRFSADRMLKDYLAVYAHLQRASLELSRVACVN